MIDHPKEQGFNEQVQKTWSCYRKSNCIPDVEYILFIKNRYRNFTAKAKRVISGRKPESQKGNSLSSGWINVLRVRCEQVVWVMCREWMKWICAMSGFIYLFSPAAGSRECRHDRRCSQQQTGAKRDRGDQRDVQVFIRSGYPLSLPPVHWSALLNFVSTAWAIRDVTAYYVLPLSYVSLL